MEGFRIAEAASGDDARSVLAHLDVDMLITDVEMPGMSGIELARAVRRDHSQMPILIMSGAAPGHLVRSLDDRCFFLEKPFSLADLISTIQDALGMQPTVTEATRDWC
jgi:DNA-binding NtrC family response regulator